MNTLKEGVYISKTGNLKTFHVDKEQNNWVVDSGETRSAVVFGNFKIIYPVVNRCSVGFPMFERFSPLYKCEWISDL